MAALTPPVDSGEAPMRASKILIHMHSNCTIVQNWLSIKLQQIFNLMSVIVLLQFVKNSFILVDILCF